MEIRPRCSIPTQRDAASVAAAILRYTQAQSGSSTVTL